ncbi:MAG: UDP-glucose 4-epimerase GalE [Chitinophagaceae bacterium]|nr:UDP-glucose 4-epimerase GalE [Chitinophagaceae bacterium]
MATILVTGGAGYIGSHTIVDLIDHGFEVISIDNFSNSNKQVFEGIKKITNQSVINYNIDLTNLDDTRKVFINHTKIDGIIHFAAFKAVGESVEKPLEYYHNNMNSLINILKCVDEFSVPHFVFSSSCTVYGNPDEACVTEQTPQQPAASPYGYTKQIGERIIEDFVHINPNKKAILLRYFNPVGAHPSALIGELPIGKPMNLVPAITQTAIGKLPKMLVYGNDYDTRDGSCVRDYIHVCDIARAHTLAIEYLIKEKNQSNIEVFNLGTGNGVTVLEAINSFEQVNDLKLNYEIGPRRAGDVVAIYANNNLAKEKLGWQTKYNINDMMQSAWKWELHLKESNH